MAKLGALIAAVAVAGGGCVATASTVHNIVGFGAGSHDDGWDHELPSNETNACINEDYIRFDERFSIEQCLLRCTRYEHNTAEAGSADSRYKDTDEAKLNDGSKRSWTWSDVAVLALIWYLFFAVVDLRQKALLLVLLLLAGYQNGAVVSFVSCFMSGVAYLMVMMAFGESLEDEDDYPYDDDEAFYSWEEGLVP